MATIRKSGKGGAHGGALRPADAGQQKKVRAARLQRILGNGAAKGLVEEAEARAKDKGGVIDGRDLSALMTRAMKKPPGGTDGNALREAIEHITDVHTLSADAKPQAEALKVMTDCRTHGSMTKKQTTDMVQDMVNRAGGKLTDEASTAIKYAAWSNGDIMDDGAKMFMTSFISSWYQDTVENGMLAEGAKQAKQALAQDKTDFKDFMTRDKTEHKRKDLSEFKDDLKENRIDSSEWQTLMIWLQTGLKKSPISQ